MKYAQDETLSEVAEESLENVPLLPHPLPESAASSRCSPKKRDDCDRHEAEGVLMAPSPTKMEEFEEDTEGEPQCRICLETGGRDLIAPCRCKGTQQFVHRSCLDHWRAVKEGFAFAHCTECKAQYHLHVDPTEEEVWRTVRFRFFVTRDAIIVFLTLQLLISMLATLVWAADYKHDLMHAFEWQTREGPEPFNLDKHPATFYYCCGVVLFFACVGAVGLFNLICNACENGTNMECDCCDHTTTCIYCTQCDLPCVECANMGVDMFPCLAGFALIMVVVFAVVGIVYGFFMATVVAQRIWQRHYHILTKRVLSLEYVVVDLQGKPYEPPTLAPEHEQHLTALGLL